LILRQQNGVAGMAGADGVLAALAGQRREGDEVFTVDVGHGLVEALGAAKFDANFHDFVEGRFGIRAEGGAAQRDGRPAGGDVHIGGNAHGVGRETEIGSGASTRLLPSISSLMALAWSVCTTIQVRPT
jgi:hypothetical protein